MTALSEPAWAKVNLFLHVTGRRPDGYHLLDSLAVFPEIGDVVSAEADAEISLALTGRFGAHLIAEPDNLVLRAARALAASAGIKKGARIVLEKNLPVASGIGGGSADAAATLVLLQRLWQAAPPEAEMMRIAAALGADVPVCLASRPRLMQGVGDVLVPAPALPECGLVLVNPGVAVPTPAVFRARSGAFSPPADLPSGWQVAQTMARDLAALRNDLEAPAIDLCPVISNVLAALRRQPGCLLARMSGSGATCFGLFADTAQATVAAAGIDHPSWWRWGGALAGPRGPTRMGLPDAAATP